MVRGALDLTMARQAAWLFTLVLSIVAPVADAQQDAGRQIEVSHIVPLVGVDHARDQLVSVAFSVRNGSNRALDSATFRVVVRNPLKAIIEQRTEAIVFERRTLRAVGPDGTVLFTTGPSTFAPGDIKQLRIFLDIRGFRTSAGMGSVDVEVTDFQLSDP
jgi:hypothetical protein